MKYEPVMLPSRGIIYPKSWTDEGRIKVRPMTVEEEEIITTVRLLKQGKAIDMVLENCIKPYNDDPEHPFSVKELLSGDRSYLLFHLRAVSYGAAYEYQETCPKCGNEYRIIHNLNELKIKYLPENFVEPIEFKLPVSGKVVQYRLMRGKDEAKLLQHQLMENQGMNRKNTSLSKRYELQIISIDGVTDKLEIAREIKHMIARDSSLLRKHMDNSACGIETGVIRECPNCLKTYESEVPVSETFFRATE